jgi:hypothetical protein
MKINLQTTPRSLPILNCVLRETREDRRILGARSVMPVDHITRVQINIDNRIAPLVVRVNRRAKRLILKVDPFAGEIHVTAPSKRAVPEAVAFARERANWIASQLDESLRARAFREDMSVPYLGKLHVIKRHGGPRTPVRVNDGPPSSICAGGEKDHLNRRITDWMKRQARLALSARVNQFCALLGEPKRPIRIRDTKTRWGSCSAEGVLSFSWRLIMAPPAILDYVAAHECAHLRHMNHSPAFWQQVAAFGVDAKSAADWFQHYGSALFSYGESRRDDLTLARAKSRRWDRLPAPSPARHNGAARRAP